VRLATGKTARVVQAAMQVQYVGAACTFVQIVYVLGDNGELGNMACQRGNGKVSGIGLRLEHLHAPPFVPAPHQLRVFAKGAGCGKVLGVKSFPQACE
jgi:hypothetical protein